MSVTPRGSSNSWSRNLSRYLAIEPPYSQLYTGAHRGRALFATTPLNSSRTPERRNVPQVENAKGQVWDAIAKVCREILAPMVRADGGEMYLVVASSDEIHLHLTG